MDVLVLGGTRFFGRRLVQSLLDLGHTVTIGTRGLQQDGFGDQVERVRLDRNDPVSMIEALSGRRYDVVYDQTCYGPRDAKAALDALGERVQRYVFTSSMAVYTHRDGIRTERDFDPLRQEVDLSAAEYAYDVGKRQAEAYLFRNAPCPVVAARVGLVASGTDDYTGRFDFHVAHVANRVSIGVPEHPQAITFVTASDTADFLRFIGVASEFSGPVNVGGSFMNAREMALLIGTHLGEQPRFHVSGTEDPDYSPYASSIARRMSVELAGELGYTFPPFAPEIPGMVDAAMEKLGLRRGTGDAGHGETSTLREGSH